MQHAPAEAVGGCETRRGRGRHGGVQVQHSGCERRDIDGDKRDVFQHLLAASLDPLMGAQWYDENISIPSCDKNVRFFQCNCQSFCL